MTKIIFKNLEKSALAREAVQDRIDHLGDKFPDLKTCRIHVTLEMENSPQQAGPDLFRVAVQFHSGRYKNVRLEKASGNLYVALAELSDHMLEKLNRFGDRSRVKERSKARKESTKSQTAEQDLPEDQ